MSAAAFRTTQEEAHLVPGEEQAPVLVFNTAAGADQLFAAAASRMQTLRRSLSAWNCAPDAEVSAVELAQILLPLAEEIELINEQLETHLRPAAASVPGGAA